MVARYRRGGLYHLLVVSGLHVVLAAGLAAFALQMLRDRRQARATRCCSRPCFSSCSSAAPIRPPSGRASWSRSFSRRACSSGRSPARRRSGSPRSSCSAALPEQIFSVGTVLTFAAVCGIALFSKPIRAAAARAAGVALLRPRGRAGRRVRDGARPLLEVQRRRGGRVDDARPSRSRSRAALIGARGGAAGAVRGRACPRARWPRSSAWAAGRSSSLAERAAGCAFLRPTPALWAMALVGRCSSRPASGRRGVAPARPRRPRRPCSSRRRSRRAPAGPPRGFSIEALDVGQGDAILLRWNRRAILVDGGGPFDLMAADFGRTRLVPKLLDRGVTRLDAVMLTHPHPDHALGLFAVLEELPVGELWRSAGEDESGPLRPARRRPPRRAAFPSGRSRPATSGSATARGSTCCTRAAPRARPTRSTTSRSWPCSRATGGARC